VVLFPPLIFEPDFSSCSCPIEVIYITIESLHPELSERGHVCILLSFRLGEKWP
jgi:hypothetical protein